MITYINFTTYSLVNENNRRSLNSENLVKLSSKLVKEIYFIVIRQ